MPVEFDGQVVQVVVVFEDDGLHGLRRGLAGFHVGGKDLVAGLELADGDGGAGGEQHLGAGREAVIAAVGKGVADVFCGDSQSSVQVGPLLLIYIAIWSYRPVSITKSQ